MAEAADREPITGRQPFARSGDPRARLPAPAQKILADLVAVNEDSSAAIRDIETKRGQLRELKRVPVNRLEALRTGRAFPGRDEDIARTAADIEAIDIEMKQLEERATRWRAQVWPGLGSVMDWLRTLPGTGVVELHREGVPVKLAKGQSLADAIAAAREAVATVRADRHTLASRPLPAAVTKARIKAEIDALAAAGRPDVMPALEIGARLRWPQKTVHASVPGSHHNIDDGLALACWLSGDAIAAKLFADVDELDSGDGIDDLERSRLDAELRKTLLAAERLETSLVEMAHRENQDCPHRVGLDPRALLHLSGDLAAPLRH